jgi:RNA polymerase primary sigma factor
MASLARSKGPLDPILPGLADSGLLSPTQERRYLRQLDACRRKLVLALHDRRGPDAGAAAEDPRTMSRLVAEANARGAFARGSLAALYRRYNHLRWRLALGNTRLVAHLARRYRERGVAYPDLLQEGFCGLIEAIDRFDLSYDTKLSTYATWWIRQAIQRAVAGGAYPVRLTTRHLQLLARHQDALEDLGERLLTRDVTLASLRQIHAATQPSLSLDGGAGAEPRPSIASLLPDPYSAEPATAESAETIDRWMQALRPREQEVLSLRFGLHGSAPLTLSEVGDVLDVSKERVRQIQDRALQKLRAVVRGDA